MKLHLMKLWDRVRSSFWFVPAMMAAGAVVLVYLTIYVDERATGGWLQDAGWAYTGSPEGASVVLGTIAGSMMTIAGVVFSMTLVALTLASSQFGPRLLRNFMSDTSNQVVLGTFVATFLYSLLVLRTIRHTEEEAFVPHLSVTLGLLFALASIGVLIYFIHHVSVSIQADEIVGRVGAELVEGIERLFPEQVGRGDPLRSDASPAADIPVVFDETSRPVGAKGDGYIQFIDADALMHTATQEDLLLRLSKRPGHYITAGSELLRVWPGERVTDQLAKRFNEAIILGKQRSPAQDVEFTVSQLVEIAVRALSPGVNDPFTAIRCIDRLGSALCRLAGRAMPSPYRRDEHHQLRVIAPSVTFASVVDAAFDQIRQNARANAAVTIRLMETIGIILDRARRPEDRAALLRQAEIILRGACDGLPEAEDYRAVEERRQAMKCPLSLNDDGSSSP